MIQHPGEFTLRRFLAQELGEPVATHLAQCPQCAARLEALKAEQRAFEAQVPFERFAAGVERAARPQRAPSRRAVIGLALAAGLVALVGVRLALQAEPTTRLKGAEAVDFVVAGPSGQRNAAPVERLAAGERVRIGVSGATYVVAASIDERGEVSTVYAEAVRGQGQTWLPDSLEFTGSGKEHLVVVLSDRPVSAADLERQLSARFQEMKGDVGQLGTLDIAGVQVHRVFVKP